MSIGLIVTGGYGNGTLVGSVGGVVSGGYLPVSTVTLSVVGTRSASVSASATVSSGVLFDPNDTSAESVSGAVGISNIPLIDVSGTIAGNVTENAYISQNHVLTLIGTVSDSISGPSLIYQISALRPIKSLSSSLSEIVGLTYTPPSSECGLTPEQEAMLSAIFTATTITGTMTEDQYNTLIDTNTTTHSTNELLINVGDTVGNTNLKINDIYTSIDALSEEVTTSTEAVEAMVSIVKYVQQAVHVNESLLVNGDGSVRKPFNNISDSLDFAELVNIKDIYVHSNVVLDRDLLNYNVTGTGSYTIDLGNYNLDNSSLYNLRVSGSYTGYLALLNCSLAHNLSGLSGKFINCSIEGNLYILDGGNATFLAPYSSVNSANLPTINAQSTSGTHVDVLGMVGMLVIEGVNYSDTLVSVEMNTGELVLGPTNVLGGLIVSGSCKYLDNSTGASVDSDALVANQVWKGIEY